MHRFQIQAVGKFIGGQYFRYVLRGDNQEAIRFVEADKQREAIEILLRTISPLELRLPDTLINSIPPRPPGFAKTREMFPTDTGTVFDPFGAIESAVALTLEVLLEPTRAARMIAAKSRNVELPGFGELTDDLLRATWYAIDSSYSYGEIRRTTNILVLERLMLLSTNQEADAQVRAIALDAVQELDNWLAIRIARESDREWRAHYRLARHQIKRMFDDPTSLESLVPVVPPPGSPIGDFSPGN